MKCVCTRAGIILSNSPLTMAWNLQTCETKQTFTTSKVSISGICQSHGELAAIRLLAYIDTLMLVQTFPGFRTTGNYFVYFIFEWNVTYYVICCRNIKLSKTPPLIPFSLVLLLLSFTSFLLFLEHLKCIPISRNLHMLLPKWETLETQHVYLINRSHLDT